MGSFLYRDSKLRCTPHYAIYRMSISVLLSYSIARIAGFSLDRPFFSCMFYEQMCQHEEFPACVLAKKVSWLAGYLIIKKFLGTMLPCTHSATYLQAFDSPTQSIYPTISLTHPPLTPSLTHPPLTPTPFHSPTSSPKPTSTP